MSCITIELPASLLITTTFDIHLKTEDGLFNLKQIQHLCSPNLKIVQTLNQLYNDWV